jgi:hypothetical protein
MRVGFKALEEQYGIVPVQPLRVESVIGSVRSHRDENGRIANQYPPSYKPVHDFPGHFEFGLKYEEIHFEFLARLFTAVGPELIQAWCRREPFGRRPQCAKTSCTTLLPASRMCLRCWPD